MSTSSSEPAIGIAGLRKEFGGAAALDGVDLRVDRGEAWALLGPNGSGKTTLLRIVATVMKPSVGRVRVFGMDVEEQTGEARRRLGYVPQAPTADPELTGMENLRFAGRLFGMGGAALDARIEELFGFFDLGADGGHPVGELSGGMRRRVEIARALVHGPRVLLLDEPTSGLDARSRRVLWETLRQLQQERGMTLLMATHRTDDAGEVCDRVAVLERGVVTRSGCSANGVLGLGAVDEP